MESKKVKWTLFFILTLISLFIFRWFYLDVVYFRLASYLSGNGLAVLENSSIAILIFILGTFFLSSTLFQIIYRSFSLKLLKIDYVAYFILLFFFLFFKSIGLRGITLNPLSFIVDFLSGQAFETFFNLIFFIPLGLLLNYKKISFSKSILVSIIGIIIIEAIQYVFSLGFFDLGDVVTNTVGIIFGWLFYSLLDKKGYRIL